MTAVAYLLTGTAGLYDEQKKRQARIMGIPLFLVATDGADVTGPEAVYLMSTIRVFINKLTR